MKLSCLLKESVLKPVGDLSLEQIIKRMGVENGDEALGKAVDNQDEEVVRILLRLGVDPVNAEYKNYAVTNLAMNKYEFYSDSDFDEETCDKAHDIWKLVNNGLDEAMRNREIGYESVRKNYEINDANPHILILDRGYPPNKPDSFLAFNLNYLKSKNLQKLIKRVQVYDDSVVGINDVEKFMSSFLKRDTEEIDKKKMKMSSILNKGIYPKGKESKINRYKSLISRFPMLKKTIRRYKYRGIK